MQAALKIRTAVGAVSLLRQAEEADPALRQAVGDIKRFQSRRFAGSYADLLAGGPYAKAARFFLDELYNDQDHAERDAQFVHIASAIEKFFPAQAADAAIALAELHALTETLDQAVAAAWLALENARLPAVQRYVTAWRAVDHRAKRQTQLTAFAGIGKQLARLTRTPGLRTILRLMRGPASVTGLRSLQRFLESGFDIFAALATGARSADEFVTIVGERESVLLAHLFDAEPAACADELRRILGQAR